MQDCHSHRKFCLGFQALPFSWYACLPVFQWSSHFILALAQISPPPGSLLWFYSSSEFPQGFVSSWNSFHFFSFSCLDKCLCYLYSSVRTSKKESVFLIIILSIMSNTVPYTYMPLSKYLVYGHKKGVIGNYFNELYSTIFFLFCRIFLRFYWDVIDI